MSGLAPCLMVQGTSSGVGKSLLTAALCRIFASAGYRVAPFKSQNMSLNAAVTAGGGEIGRAQAAQAEAAGIAPSVDHNPILLKPEGDDRSQVIVMGRVVATAGFREYGRMLPDLLPTVTACLERLRRAHDVVVIEGAGSPAEINLAAMDIVNMRIARMAQAPVLLAGDIDRGGVFAAFVGTLALLEPADRARVAGFIVNKFRGDLSLLSPGLDALTRRTAVPVLGVVPYITERLMPAEDSLDLFEHGGRERAPRPPGGGHALDIAVIRLPRIANFDDFEPLAREAGVRVHFVQEPGQLARADLIVLPGTKSTVADLRWLRERGFAEVVSAAAAAGRPVLGICGGFQMLGACVRDPGHVESQEDSVPGLGLLPAVTTFAGRKSTVQVRARVSATAGFLAGAAGVTVDAYEIHAGLTDRGGAPAVFDSLERAGAMTEDGEGAVSARGNVVGTYLHGLFSSGALRRAMLEALARRRGHPGGASWGAPEPNRYDRLAALVAPALDLRAIGALVGIDMAPAAPVHAAREGAPAR
jgi:adenosylcobyric acid synthase